MSELYSHPYLFYTFLSLFFLAIGSLLNVIIYRIPIMLEQEWKQECYALFNVKPKKHEDNINLFFPRSFCPDCKTKVPAWHNIPLLSFLFLKGRCFHCNISISYRYPLIELGTLILSLYACWHFGFTPTLVFALMAIWILICLFFIDFDYQLLPDSLTLSLLWLGLIANCYTLFSPLPTAVFSAAGGYLSLWVCIHLLYLMTGKMGMGHGDFKLFAAFGAWFGWQFLPFILFFSAFIGALVAGIYLYSHKKSTDTHIPFGPFLCLSGLITLFWGQPLLSWYFERFFA